MEVAAAPERSWEALCRVAGRSFEGSGRGLFARLIGVADRQASGSVDEPGSTIVGFHVVRAEAPVELALEGNHRFSRYALTFRIEGAGVASRVRAETHAEFPGVHGRLYKALVIGSGVHVLVTKRMLRAVKARAEDSGAA